MIFGQRSDVEMKSLQIINTKIKQGKSEQELYGFCIHTNTSPLSKPPHQKRISYGDRVQGLWK